MSNTNSNANDTYKILANNLVPIKGFASNFATSILGQINRGDTLSAKQIALLERLTSEHAANIREHLTGTINDLRTDLAGSELAEDPHAIAVINKIIERITRNLEHVPN
jgi:hypothetical protein